MRRGREIGGRLTSLRLADLRSTRTPQGDTAGKRLELTRRVQLLSCFFCVGAERVLSRTVMAEQVWDINFDSDTNVVEVRCAGCAKLDEPLVAKDPHGPRNGLRDGGASGEVARRRRW